jgi:hypothetical protein
MAQVYSIGLPENASERKAIGYLKNNLPDDFVLFHNLELPTPHGLPYQYDLIVVGQAVYVVEIKGYRGEIRGNAREWELGSGVIYKSPIPLANKKAKALSERLQKRSPNLGKVWVESLILLTADRVRVHLNDPRANEVVRMDAVVSYLTNPKRSHTQRDLTQKDITQVKEAIGQEFMPLRRSNEIGEYRVSEQIGTNNLYTTLLAEHRLIRSKNRFTLKVYSFDVYAAPEERSKQKEWILRDANALHQLEGHPNIVRAYPPFPWEDNQIVLPLEWVDGYSLRGLIDEKSPMDFSRKVDIIRQVCEGLNFAHAHGVIHRDIRLNNIIVPREGPIRLVNFDCARIEGNHMRTIADQINLQLDERYLAPEVWHNAPGASPASDIYSLGIVFFELLIGQPPYQEIQEVLVAKGLPRLPRQIDPNLPTGVDEIIARMCAFRPDNRYANLTEVIEDLDRIG